MKKFYKRYLKPLGVPLQYINEKPYHFLTWAAVAIILGLSGVWLPTLLAAMRGKDAYEVLLSLVNGGGLAAFSVVLLADGIAASMVSEKTSTGPHPTATGVRGMISSYAIILVVVQVGVLGIVQAVTDSSYPSFRFQALITILAIILACYLYCFRSDKWEQLVEDAAAAAEKENAEVKDLAKDAATKTTDDGGVKL